MSEKTFIIYQGGHHGNFLRYIGNTAWHKRPIRSPFAPNGTSHADENEKVPSDRFQVLHWFSKDPELYAPEDDFGWGVEKAVPAEWFNPNWQFIVITASPAHMFEMTWLSFKRACNFNLDLNGLTQNTKQTLSTVLGWREMYDLIISNYNINPGDDVPRHVLREFFKFPFVDSDVSTAMITDNEFDKLLSDAGIKYFNFPLEAFYNTSLFKETLTDLSKFTDCEFDLDRLEELHLEFLDGLKEMFDLKNQADEIISNVLSNVSSDIPNLDLLQESYINGTLEKITGVEMPFDRPKEYFTSTKQIMDHIEYARSKIS